MALNKEILINSLSSFIDEKSIYFIDWPKTQEESAQFFSDALNKYSLPVIPTSTTFNEAKLAFFNILKEMSYDLKNGETLLISGLNAFCATLGMGMIGISSIVSVIPPQFSELDFSQIWNHGKNGGDSKTCIDMFSTIIDNKFKTGQCTTSTGAIILWI